MDKQVKNCQNCKKDFIIEPEDFDFYERMNVMPPTFCPECREVRRIAFRNERSLYKRKCDLCGNMVVSRVSPDKPYPMYCRDCWWSDKWDPMTYGKDYDFSRPFFEQFKELFFLVPSVSIFNENMVNSDWVNQETDDKNCYLNVGGHFNEDSAYNTYEIRGKECFDNYWIFNSDRCYGNITCGHCYQTTFSENCNDCRDVHLSFNCRNCSNCFGCIGLRNAEYYLWNKSVGKEAYQEFMKTRPLASTTRFSEHYRSAMKIWNIFPHRPLNIFKSVNVSGDSIMNSKNAHHIWSGEKLENSKYHYIVASLKECFDLSAVGWSELSLECSSSVGLYNSKGVLFAVGGGGAEKMHSSNIEHSHTIMSCHNCFGCVGLKKKEYCILNKQYTAEEYEALVPKIIEHMRAMPYIDKKGRKYFYGDSLPIEISNYGYNETVAQDYYPLTREEALAEGYPWCDYQMDSNYQISDYVVPDDIKDVSEDITQKILSCTVSKKPFRVVPMELAFYKKMDIAIPRLSPLERHKERMSRLPPRKLYERICACGLATSEENYKNTSKHEHGDSPCGKKIKTTYASERPELVYCEECYQKEVL